MNITLQLKTKLFLEKKEPTCISIPESVFRLIHKVLDPFMTFWPMLKKDWVQLVGLSFLDAHLC